MTLIRYTINAYRCDRLGCDHEYEGHAGQTAAEVREAAKAEGWHFWHKSHATCPCEHGPIMAELEERAGRLDG